MRTRWLLALLLLPAGCVGTTQDEPVQVTVKVLALRHGDADLWYEVDMPSPTGQALLSLDDGGGPADLREYPLVEGGAAIAVPFLEPSTRYDVTFRVQGSDDRDAVAHIEFTTPASAYQWMDPAAAVLRPGDPLGDGCTLGFLARDGSNETVYALTAGHCGAAEGEELVSRGVRVGTVVHRGEAGKEGEDWAVARLDPDARANASASVRYWTGPSPYAAAADNGDTVCLHGQGPSPEGRHLLHRCGSVLEAKADAAIVRYKIESFAGDSGAPVLAYEDGAPLAIHVSSNAFQEAVGTSIPYLLRTLQERHGLGLRVATVPYSPPPADPFG